MSNVRKISALTVTVISCGTLLRGNNGNWRSCGPMSPILVAGTGAEGWRLNHEESLKIDKSTVLLDSTLFGGTVRVVAVAVFGSAEISPSHP